MYMCASACPPIENTAPQAIGLRGNRCLRCRNALRAGNRPEGVFIFAHVRESAGPGFQPGRRLAWVGDLCYPALEVIQ